MSENYNSNPVHERFRATRFPSRIRGAMDDNLHSPARRLIELRIEHADLDNLIDRTVAEHPDDELMLRRLKKRRLALRDRIAVLEISLDPPEPA
jgi:hypothetical protein